MKILYFGTYEKNYSRNRIIIDGLRKNKQEVKECHFCLWEEKDKTKKKINFLRLIVLAFKICTAYLILLIRYLRLNFDYDVMIVGYPGHLDIILAKILTFFRQKPLVFNPLISLYDSIVYDRSLIRPSSATARLILVWEKFIYHKSDFIILDTNIHIDYFVHQFNLPYSKFQRIFVGAEDIFFKQNLVKKKNRKFKVLFFGKFIPLHGIEYILNAAKKLENNRDIAFEIIGSGQLSKKIKQKAKKDEIKNINFIEWIPYKKLPKFIAQADICLGIFGQSNKAQRVIPNKVFQSVALGKLVITENSPAILEAFNDEENIILCNKGDSSLLAQKIIRLKKYNKLRNKIGWNAYNLFKNKFTTDQIGFEVKNFLEIINKNF